jgi:hypothetical protein
VARLHTVACLWTRDHTASDTFQRLTPAAADDETLATDRRRNTPSSNAAHGALNTFLLHGLLLLLCCRLQSAFIQQPSFQYILRILNTNVDGRRSEFDNRAGSNRPLRTGCPQSRVACAAAPRLQLVSYLPFVRCLQRSSMR